MFSADTEKLYALSADLEKLRSRMHLRAEEASKARTRLAAAGAAQTAAGLDQTLKGMEEHAECIRKLADVLAAAAGQYREAEDEVLNLTRERPPAGTPVRGLITNEFRGYKDRFSRKIYTHNPENDDE